MKGLPMRYGVEVAWGPSEPMYRWTYELFYQLWEARRECKVARRMGWPIVVIKEVKEEVDHG